MTDLTDKIETASTRELAEMIADGDIEVLGGDVLIANRVSGLEPPEMTRCHSLSDGACDRVRNVAKAM